MDAATDGTAIVAINWIIAILTIGFGAIGLCWPDYAMGALKLQAVDDRPEGRSELRASSGGAFVIMGVAGIALGATQPFAWVMMGVHYLGAGLGRIVSIVRDQAGTQKIWIFFLIELLFGAWLVAANWP